jgi:hypothetical protein
MVPSQTTSPGALKPQAGSRAKSGSRSRIASRHAAIAAVGNPDPVGDHPLGELRPPSWVTRSKSVSRLPASLARDRGTVLALETGLEQAQSRLAIGIEASPRGFARRV